MKGLGKVQKNDIEVTEQIILDILPTSAEWQKIKDIIQKTGLSRLTVAKRMRGLVAKGKVLEFRGTTHSGNKSQKRRHFCHFYCLPNSIADSNQRFLNMQESRKRRLLKHTIKDVRFWMIQKAMIEIEHNKHDKNLVLFHCGFSERCYESKIRRSPVLTRLRETLRQHEGLQITSDLQRLSHKELLEKISLIN